MVVSSSRYWLSIPIYPCLTQHPKTKQMFQTLTLYFKEKQRPYMISHFSKQCLKSAELIEAFTNDHNNFELTNYFSGRRGHLNVNY